MSERASGDVMTNGAPSRNERVAARVSERVITVEEVAARERTLRAGPFAARLPVASSPQGRNVLRWIVQLMAAEELIVQEATARGIGDDVSSMQPRLDVAAAVSLGGVAATVLATVPAAHRVRDAVTADLTEDDADVRAHYERNLDRFTTPEARELDEVHPGGPRHWARVPLGVLPPRWERLLFDAAVGVPVAVTPDRTFVVREIVTAVRRPFEQVREELREELRGRARDLAFAGWLQRRTHAMVELGHGYEHPGDPAQPDVTHRH